MEHIENAQQPYWFMLLDQWVNKEQNTGLSIPFLIGTKHEFLVAEKPDESAIPLFFENILAHTLPNHCAALSYCNTIRAYILTIIPRIDVEPPYFLGKEGKPALALLDAAFGKEVSLEWIVNFLKDEYSEPILNGTYSRKNFSTNGWASFDEKDIKQIKAALNFK